jgi:hypothetical protein
MPAGRVECLVCLLEMVSYERCALIELARVEFLDGPGDSAMEWSTVGAELRMIRYFPCQRVLECVFGLRRARSLVEKLR